MSYTPNAPDLVSTESFNFLGGAQKAFAEASTLGFTKTPKWFTLKSHKTGKRVDLFLKDTHISDEGEVLSWLYRPHSLPYGNNNRNLEDWMFIISND